MMALSTTIKRIFYIRIISRAWPLIALATLAALALALPCQADTIRIQPLGDSITHGGPVEGGYRTHLYELLTNDGYTVDYLGSLSKGPAALPDKEHEGHIGYFIRQIMVGLDGWMAGYPNMPTDVLLMAGTNDMTSNWDLPNAPARLGALIDHICAKVPTATVWVASIPPLAMTINNERAIAYNAEIPGLVAARVAEGKNVRFVDIYSALDASTDLVSDGVHPNASGQYKIAEAWYAAGVPEPTSLALLALGGAALLRRRGQA